MKKLLLSFIFGISLFMMPNLQANPINDTVVMGPGYANDVFYSLANGVVKTEIRANWELAFYTNRWSAGISINDGSGVMLYTYPLGDASAWNNIDVSNIENWKNLVNSDTIWEDGAFNRNALGHPDYGWGVYNTINHDVMGDSIYIVKMADGGLRKLFIERKNSVSNKFYFKYANIDGTNEVNQVLDVTPYQDSRMFIYYSLTMAAVVDREPDINSWDLQFSRYSAIVFDNTGAPSDYVVVGITTNNEVGAARNYPVAPDFIGWTAQPMEFHRTPIGHNWKEFNMSAFSWVIQDSLAYFVQSRQGDIYKLTLNYFSGSGSGKTGFTKQLVSMVSLGETDATNTSLSVYPNPAKSFAVLKLNVDNNVPVQVKLFTLDGKMVFNQQMTNTANGLKLSLDGFDNGMYIVETLSQGQTQKVKFIINR